MGEYIKMEWMPLDASMGTKKDRQSFDYEAFVPDKIADLDPILPSSVYEIVKEAEFACEKLQEIASISGLESLARPLLRSEAIGSSWIEGISISHKRLAKAVFDEQNSDNTAKAVVGNIRAMEEAIELGKSKQDFKMDDFIKIHNLLLEKTSDQKLAGIIAESQNWIGGRGFSPADAEYIPPPYEIKVPLLKDLTDFINQKDLSPIIQAAVVHAQFESIHPFIDGNGRTGRCLIYAVFGRSGLIPYFIPPISVILALNPKGYINGLKDFREGNLQDWVATFALATKSAAEKFLILSEQIGNLTEDWNKKSGKLRAGSAAQNIITLLPAQPIVDIESVAKSLNLSLQASRLGLNQLEEKGVLKALRTSRYKQAWGAMEIFEILKNFEANLLISDTPDVEGINF